MGHMEEQAGAAVIVVHLPCESRPTATVMMIPVHKAETNPGAGLCRIP